MQDKDDKIVGNSMLKDITFSELERTDKESVRDHFKVLS